LRRDGDPVAAVTAATLTGIREHHGEVLVLDGIDLVIGDRELVALTGPSGAGKTTLLRILLGLAMPTSGCVRIADAVATDGARLAIPPERRGVGAVFQDLALWPHLTVHGNLAFGIAQNRDARIADMLRRVDLVDKADRYPGELSGGERQRVAIARALVGDPRVLALDEPLANLDVVLARELLALFVALIRERGIAALYITHDPRDLEVADRIYVLERGRVTQTGTLAELRAQPATSFIRALTGEPSS
jgi:iron(III) transport system ATP-binding protein